MAQTWSIVDKITVHLPGPSDHSTGLTNPRAMVLATLKGPQTSVSSGMAIASLNSTLIHHCYGGWVDPMVATKTYHFDVMPSSTFTTSATKIVARRRSTMANLTSAVVLTSIYIRVGLFGY